MSGEADDLLLSLMQIADDPEEISVPKGPSTNPLAKMKPYYSHKGCGGMVSFIPGSDDEDNIVIQASCMKCGFADYISPNTLMTSGDTLRIVGDLPDWVEAPHV